MKVLLALLLSAALTPAAYADSARDLTETGIRGAVVLSHDGIHTAAYLAGERQVVVLVDEQPLSKREEAAVNRTLDAALCS